jgi:phosphatidylserine decarboxylase
MKVNSQANTLDQALVALHRLIPARLLARFVYRLSRSEHSWLKNLLIRMFCKLYPVDMSEAENPNAEAYASFNAFFTRKLKSGARNFGINATCLLSPADGTVAQTGLARDGQLMQAKGMEFSVAALLGNTELARRFDSAPFATVYLAPYDYHRVHMPVGGRLISSRFIPGKLYSVNARTTAVIPNLYALNERLVCEFATELGPFALVLVGAMNVASISTAWEGEILAQGNSGVIDRQYPQDNSVQLAQGDYMGHFNLGSTVVMLGPPGACAWQSHLTPGTAVRVGEVMGTLKPS